MVVRASLRRWGVRVGVVCILVGIYLSGLLEYIAAKPYSQFSWPLEINLTQVITDYDKGIVHDDGKINEHNFKLLLEPTVDTCREYKLLTVLIKSRVNDLKSREVLRETWVKTLKNNGYRYIFLLGICDTESTAECQSLVEEEQTKYGDLLQGEFTDSYGNNTLKMTMAFGYITDQCLPHSSTLYTLLIDNDYSLNVNNLNTYLKYTAVSSNLYAGNVWAKSRPFRLPLHKHYMSLAEYPYSHYPPFVSAGAMLLSADVVEKFYIVSKFTKYYPFDDVFYGFVAKKLEITPSNLGDLLPSYFNVPSVSDVANEHLIGSHRFGNMDEVRILHEKFSQN